MRFPYHETIEKTCDLAAWLLRMRLRITGLDNIVDQPTVFVPNHFTRLETMLMPYLLHKHCGTMPHTLGMHGLFEGPAARFLRSVGVMSVKHPQRNRTIIRELITNANDWIIYAEGGLIKNKKTVRNGRLFLSHPSHEGPPHTGAALLALKAEISRQRYLQACSSEDMLRREFYEKEFDLQHPEQTSQKPVVLQPVSITFSPLRAGDTFVSRLAARMSRNINAKLLEEIAFESSMVLNRAEINIHFGEPIDVQQYLDMPRTVVRRIMSRFSEQRHADLLLRRQARRLTRDVMRSVYTGVEVNVDHLFAAALQQREESTIRRRDLEAAVLLAARAIAADDRVRVHRDLRNGISRIVTTNDYAPFRKAMDLAVAQRIVRIDGDTLQIDHARLNEDVDFDAVRMTNTLQVLANEVEPHRRVLKAVRQLVNLPSQELQQRVATLLHNEHIGAFEGDYERWYRPEISKSADVGQPYLLKSTASDVGVLLVHGYLSSPQQMRPLAEYLHDRGFTVYSVRLPSHATSPDQLTDAQWTDWLEAVRQGYCLLQQTCNRVIVGGLSLGGALSLLLSASDGIQPTAVFAINPPLRLRDRRAAFVPAVLRWRQTLSRFGMGPSALELLASNTESPDLSYEHHPLHSIRQVCLAIRSCRRKLEHVTAPVLLIQGDRDPIVSPAGAREALRSINSELRLLTVLPFERHNIVSGTGKELVFQSLNRFLIRVLGGNVPAEPQQDDGPRHVRWHQRLARAGLIRMLS